MAFRLIAKQFQKNTSLVRMMLYRQFGSVIKLEMPALSPTMSDGTIIQWNKKEGDQVKVGEVVCEIQTDKATVGYESQDEGYLAKILFPNDSKGVPVGQLIGLLVEEKEDIKTVDVSKYQKTGASPKKEAAPAQQPKDAEKQESGAAPSKT